MIDTLIFAAVEVPILAAILLLFVKGAALRRTVVLASAAITCLSAIVMAGQGSFFYDLPTFFGMPTDSLMAFLDFALLLVVLGISFTLKKRTATYLTLFQIAGLVILDFFMGHGKAAPAFYADNLAMVMVLVISLVGYAIIIYGLGYMDEHEHHLHLTKTKQGRFFFFLVLFIGAMNGLVLSNNLSYLYFFWEVTTLCSFMLISHDGDELSKTNAERALWMNMLGGAAFVVALIFMQKTFGTLALQDIMATGKTAQLALIPIFLLCFAGFTKSAQVPFQSWLCGAMVAPTPVSALLHSSTMVKAGVYLILRLAPAYVGTSFSTMVALFGAFSFLAASALAMSQSNGKKILAYSTIANLGMIIACAGINTPAAMTAGIMLIVFHAVSKGLMFLCVGSIEQTIGSRDIEDMRGLYKVMPVTTILAVIGVMTMLLPPFGVLLAKWMIIESSARIMPVVVLLALGSALNVVFWARWAGMLLSSNFSEHAPTPEAKPAVMQLPMKVLAYGAVGMSLFAPFMYARLVEPAAELYQKFAGANLQAALMRVSDIYVIYPIFVIMGLGFFYAVHMARKVSAKEASAPYMCGEQMTEGGLSGFKGPLRQFVANKASNYYLENIFGEGAITKYVNLIGLALLLAAIVGVF